jgi:hypothetical protein
VRSTGPILAAGAVTLFNDVVVNRKSVGQDARVVIATAIAAGGLALLEKLSAELAVGLGWLVFISVMFIRVDASTPSPVESILKFYNQIK